MASIINSTDTGQGGLIATGDNSDELQLQTAETTAVTIDSNQNVGVGTTTPATYGKFVAYSSGGYFSVDSNGQVNSTQALDVATAGGRFTGSSSRGALGSIHIEQTTTSADGGYIQFRTSPSGSTTPAARMTIDSSGNLDMTAAGSGNIKFKNGSGIDFSASAGGGATSSILDDYEEGTWTPSVGGTATYGTNYGKYTKIGNVVTCQFKIRIISIGTGSTFQMGGLPFTSANINDVQTGCCSYFASLPTNTTTLSLYVQNNATTMYFVGQDAADGSCINAMVVFGNNADIYGAVSYFVS